MLRTLVVAAQSKGRTSCPSGSLARAIGAARPAHGPCRSATRLVKPRPASREPRAMRTDRLSGTRAPGEDLMEEGLVGCRSPRVRVLVIAAASLIGLASVMAASPQPGGGRNEEPSKLAVLKQTAEQAKGQIPVLDAAWKRTSNAVADLSTATTGREVEQKTTSALAAISDSEEQTKKLRKIVRSIVNGFDGVGELADTPQQRQSLDHLFGQVSNIESRLAQFSKTTISAASGMASQATILKNAIAKMTEAAEKKSKSETLISGDSVSYKFDAIRGMFASVELVLDAHEEFHKILRVTTQVVAMQRAETTEQKDAIKGIIGESEDFVSAMDELGRTGEEMMNAANQLLVAMIGGMNGIDLSDINLDTGAIGDLQLKFQKPIEGTIDHCRDGIDNDGDGLIDYDDEDCLFVKSAEEQGLLD